MARRVKNTTAKPGATAADRRVLTDETAITAAPTQSSDGYVVEQNEFVNLLFEVGGTNPVFRVRIWWYSEISGTWHKGQQVVINANDIVTAEAQGLRRVYLQVETTPSGTNPTLNAWIGLVRAI